MVEESKSQVGSIAKIAGILGAVTGLLAIFAPVYDMGTDSAARALSFLDIFQSAIGVGYKYPEELVVRFWIMVPLLLVTIVAGLISGVNCIQGNKANRAMALLPAIAMALFSVLVTYMRFGEKFVTAAPDIFAWILLILAITAAVLNERLWSHEG